MAYRVVWSPRALDDVDAIASYISRRFDGACIRGRNQDYPLDENALTISARGSRRP
jgi:hypothetical protein